EWLQVHRGSRTGPWTGPRWFVDTDSGVLFGDLIRRALPNRSIRSLRYCIVSSCLKLETIGPLACPGSDVDTTITIHTNSIPCILYRDVDITYVRRERRTLATRAGVLLPHKPRQDAAPDRARPADPHAGHRRPPEHHRAQNPADRRRPRQGRVRRARARGAAQRLHREHPPAPRTAHPARHRHRIPARRPA